MTKKIGLFLLTVALLLTVTAVSVFAETVLPEYESRKLTAEELDAFFNAGNKEYKGDVVDAVYDALEYPEAACGMVYTAVGTEDEILDSPYANYFVDFEIVSDKDVSVLLLGNYGDYGTVPAGIVNLEAGVPLNVMESAAEIPAYRAWDDFTYVDVALHIREFKCVALPLTEDFLKAYHSVAMEGEYDEEAVLAEFVADVNPLGATSFSKQEEAVSLSISIDLYETELGENNKLVKTGVKVDIGEETEFVSYPTIPLYESSVLGEDELDAFFADPNTQYGGDLVEAIYNQLTAPTESVFGMNFKAVEDFDTAYDAPYAYYNPDFIVSSDKDVTVILAGNYGEYNTIPMGLISLKAGEPVRVMQMLQQIEPKWTCNYLDAVLAVKSFDGVAMVLSEDVLFAIYNIKCEQDEEFLLNNPTYSEEAKQNLLEALAADETLNFFGAEAFAVADGDVELGLDLKLFETELVGSERIETGKSWTVSDNNDFDFVPAEEVSIMQKLLIVNNMKAKDGYNVLNVAAAIDSLKYNEVGFKVTVVDMNGAIETATQTVSTTTVYKNMKVTNAYDTETVYTSAELGGSYVFGCEIKLDAEDYTNANTKIVIVPYAIDLNGNEILGKQVTLNDAIIKNKMPDSALFRN